MTRKEYNAISDAIRYVREHPWPMLPHLTGMEAATETMDRIAEGIATVMQRDNPRFDYTRFMRACGVFE